MTGALSFIMSPAGRFAALLAGVLAFGLFMDHRGYSRASRACESASLRAEIAILKADHKAAADAAKRFEGEAKANADQATKNATIIEGFRNAKNPACVLSDADARRLRNIR